MWVAKLQHRLPHIFDLIALSVRLMASINVLNIEIPNNPAPFLAPFMFEVTFECFAPLEEGATNGRPHPRGFWVAVVARLFFFSFPERSCAAGGSAKRMPAYGTMPFHSILYGWKESLSRGAVAPRPQPGCAFHHCVTFLSNLIRWIFFFFLSMVSLRLSHRRVAPMQIWSGEWCTSDQQRAKSTTKSCPASW